MKQLFFFLIVFILSINSVYAIDVTPVKKGERVPEDGFFVDSENMKEFRRINETNKVLKEKNIKLEQLAVIKNERIELYKKERNEVYGELRKERSRSFWKGTGGFVLGVLATSAAAYAAIQATK